MSEKYDEKLRDLSNKPPTPQRPSKKQTQAHNDGMLIYKPKQRYHEMKYIRQPYNIEDIKVMTVEGFMNETDSHGNPWWHPNFITIFAGSTRSGKSHFFKWCMYYAVCHSKVWNLKWIRAYSGTGRVTSDLDFLDRNAIKRKFSDAEFRYILDSSYAQLEKQVEEGKEPKLPHGMIILDDQMGSLEARSKAVELRYGETADIWNFFATQGRRLGISATILCQQFQWCNTKVRDNAAYLFCPVISGTGVDYIYTQVEKFNVFDNKKHFKEWCNSVTTKFQIICFNMHATEPEDMIRLVRAEENSPPKFKFRMYRTKQGTNKVTELESAIAKAETAKQEEEEKENDDDTKEEICLLS